MTPTPSRLLAELERLLARKADELGVPGAVVGFADASRDWVAPVGVTRLPDGSRVLEDTLFQVGSVTKVLTATLVMGLVDDGALALADPVADHLPGFCVGGDAQLTRSVTVEHLLSHRAGFDGDNFWDLGEGDDAIARYVEGLRTVPFLSRPGEYFAYNNAGYVVLGRLVEILTGTTYDQCLRQRLLDPAGLRRFATSAAEAIMTSTAVGHVVGEDGRVRAAPRWAIYDSMAPAGSLLAMSARDVLGFTRLHMVDQPGCATGVLSPDGAESMRTPVAPLPGEPASSMALGWGSTIVDGVQILSHAGSTIGQHSLVLVVPERRQAVVVLTNGSRGAQLADDVARVVLAELAGLQLPRDGDVGDLTSPPEPTRFVGTFACAGATVTLSLREDGALVAGVRQLREEDGTLGPAEDFLIGLADGGKLVGLGAEGRPAFDLVFSAADPDGIAEPAVLQAFGRVMVRNHRAV